MSQSAPSAMLYTLDEVAERLGLHVRTVRAYVRSGRLAAARIGKQYRVTEGDLEAFIGRAPAGVASEEVGRVRYVEVSSIVQIEAVSPELASRMTNGILGAAHGRRSEHPPLRVDSQYDETRGRLRLIFTSDPATTASLLGLVQLYLQ
jgi:excisionase family DNA binding protein